MNSWLTAMPPLQVALIEEAKRDIGICEEPLGTNSSPEIDDYLRRLGVPLKNPWCAAALAKWADAAHVARPAGSSACSCDAWMNWAKARGSWVANPQPGYIVIYGKKGQNGQPDDAQHIGVILRVRPIALSIEGNRGFGPATPEGVAVDMGPVSQGWVLGYVRPEAA